MKTTEISPTKVIIFIVLAVIVLGGFVWAVQSGFLKRTSSGNVEPAQLPAGIVFFYGDTCTHCKDVEDFIAANQIDQKVKYTSMEVFENQNNAQLLINIGTSCGLKSSDIGAVPLVYDGTKCYLGTPDVENFLKAQTGIK
jgi:hypothetical protein